MEVVLFTTFWFLFRIKTLPEELSQSLCADPKSQHYWHSIHTSLNSLWDCILLILPIFKSHNISPEHDYWGCFGWCCIVLDNVATCLMALEVMTSAGCCSAGGTEQHCVEHAGAAMLQALRGVTRCYTLILAGALVFEACFMDRLTFSPLTSVCVTQRGWGLKQAACFRSVRLDITAKHVKSDGVLLHAGDLFVRKVMQ